MARLGTTKRNSSWWANFRKEGNPIAQEIQRRSILGERRLVDFHDGHRPRPSRHGVPYLSGEI